MPKRTFATLVVVLAACSLSGCGRGCAKQEEQTATDVAEKKANTVVKVSDEDVDIDLKDGSVEIKTANDSRKMRTGEDMPIPDDFPKSMIIYDGAKLSQYLNTPGAVSTTFTSTDAMDEIVSGIKEKLEGDGWQSANTMAMPQMNVSTYVKDGDSLSVFVNEGEGMRTITQTLKKN